ncbi:MAG: hypothetical protein ACI4T3_05485 [Lactobacillus sp.]|jgi:hypothetical protein
MNNSKKLNTVDLVSIIGGSIIRLTPYVLYNTKTHKTIPDNNAIWRTATHTVVNGWLEYGPWGNRGY